jgi:hypothetical protein
MDAQVSVAKADDAKSDAAGAAPRLRVLMAFLPGGPVSSLKAIDEKSLSRSPRTGKSFSEIF